MNRNYGWRRQLHDQRDRLFLADITVTLPGLVDHRASCPPVYDQGALGSCTGNAIAAAFQYNHIKEKLEAWTPSRLFIYYNERVLEGTVMSDSGAIIRDGIKTTVKQGVCPEREWPYAPQRFTTKPPSMCYRSAQNHKTLSYASIPSNDIYRMKVALAGGEVFVFGFSVYESFESKAVAESGIVQLPGKDERLLGGHAVTAVGYDDSQNAFIVRNSWGEGWGLSGYFLLPYAYMNGRLANDFWVINSVK